jgi:hypothetical protein
MKSLPLWRRPYLADRVLDIGAGHNPFRGVTHVLERHIVESRERGHNQLAVPRSARLAVGDAEALPFGRRTFDFVYASHVLEHVRQPALACREIMRVGAAGYIETPSPFLEQGLSLVSNEPPGDWFHRWFVFVSNKTLTFEPKTTESIHEFCTCSDGRFMSELYKSLDFVEAQHCFRKSAKTTTMYWKRSFRFEIRNRTMNCEQSTAVCRFQGMRQAVLSNCHDLLRARRVLRLAADFPLCAEVFRKYGHRTLLLR